MDDSVRQHREFLKSEFSGFSAEGPSDQQKGVPYPPLEKPADAEAKRVELPEPDRSVINKADVFECIGERRSRRKFADQPLSLEQLSFLLWASQGLKKELGEV